MKKNVEVFAASRNEKALTWRVSDLFLNKKPSKGDQYVLYTSDGLLIPAYCNREGKTLYTSDGQVPKSISNRPSVGDPISISIVRVLKLRS